MVYLGLPINSVVIFHGYVKNQMVYPIIIPSISWNIGISMAMQQEPIDWRYLAFFCWPIFLEFPLTLGYVWDMMHILGL